MKFVIGDGEPAMEVKLTLRIYKDGLIKNKEMVYLEANGQILMGFKDGKYRLFSNTEDVDGLATTVNGLLVQDQTL